MTDEGMTSARDGCYGGASLAGAVIGTFLTTILLLAVAALIYRQWRRHKGKHLVLVTNPEIVEDAYAFDNPCFKDATPSVARNHDSRPLSTASLVVETSPNVKDSARWSSPWSSLGLPSVNKNDRRRTLDDSCLGSKATRVSVVSLRSRDFTGLGFNVCGNMREGIFVKDLLHRGPASESGRINPGDRIGSVKISFRSMVYEDALTILSYASPYDVELEVETGGSGAGSRPATLLKKTVGPSPSRICHPLYRSQSIPELSQTHKTSAKRLFIADPNESLSSNYSTMNSTLKSSKSTPGSQTLERRHEDAKYPNNHHANHQKFGIKVLPALDGTVHRIENQNEHNTNLERRNSRKTDIDIDPCNDKTLNNIGKNENSTLTNDDENSIASERYQKRENSRKRESTNVATLPIDNNVTTFDRETNGHDATDRSSITRISMDKINIPSEVPAEVHNAAMAARRNRKNSMELLNVGKTTNDQDNTETHDPKSPQKNKRKAPAPPTIVSNENDTETSVVSSINNDTARKNEHEDPDDSIESINDYAESLNDYVVKTRETTIEKDSPAGRRSVDDKTSKRQKSDSDSDGDSVIHDSFTTIELKPADITIHQTPLPTADNEANNDGNDDVYRKAASLGDLSRYENKSLATLERAQSLDMADAGSKKRKLTITPDDINESSEDLTKFDDVDSFDRRKLKKSNEWGTLEDALWKKKDNVTGTRINPRKRASNGYFERSKSSAGIAASSDDENEKIVDSAGRLVPIFINDDTSIELYNLPLSMRLTREFIRTERTFNPDEDNSLARIVNNGRIVKSPTPEDTDLDFRRAATAITDDDDVKITRIESLTTMASSLNEEFVDSPRFDREARESSVNLVDIDKTRKNDDFTRFDRKFENVDPLMYAGRKEVEEEPMRKVTVITGCPGCERKHSHHDRDCTRPAGNNNRDNDWQPQDLSKLPADDTKDDTSGSSSAFKIGLTRFENGNDERTPKTKTLMRDERRFEIDDDDEKKTGRRNDDEEKKNVDNEFVEKRDSESALKSKIDDTTSMDRECVSNVRVSSVDNNDNNDSTGKYDRYVSRDSDSRPPALPETPMPSSGLPQKLTYITEIKVSTGEEKMSDGAHERGDFTTRRDNVKPPRTDVPTNANGKSGVSKKPPVPPRRNDASRQQSRDLNDTIGNDKQIVYVSEYKTTSGKDKNENTERISGNIPADGKSGGKKKFENWIFLGDDNKEQNPWGNGSSQAQSVTNVVVTPSDKDEKL